MDLSVFKQRFMTVSRSLMGETKAIEILQFISSGSVFVRQPTIKLKYF